MVQSFTSTGMIRRLSLGSITMKRLLSSTSLITLTKPSINGLSTHEGDTMNASVMHQLEQSLNTPALADVTMTQHDPKHVEPIAKLLQRIDDTDLIKAHNHYAQLLDQSSQEILSRMRHRATMLRERANQLDHEADAFEKKQSILTKRNFDIMEDIEEIENILHSLAHIEPQRV